MQDLTKKIITLVTILCLVAVMRSIPENRILGAESAPLSMYSDRLIYSQKGDTVQLIGNVRFTYKDTILTGLTANFNTKTRKGDISGGVKLAQPGTVITGNEMKIDYSRQSAVLSGDVTITTSKNPSGNTGEKDDSLNSGVTTVRCDEITYNWLLREGLARGSVIVEQKGRRAFADRARYSGASDLITLEDRVRFEQGSNDWVTCDKAYIDMKKETFMATGGVSGHFLVEGDKKKETKTQEKPVPADKITIPPLPYEN